MTEQPPHLRVAGPDEVPPTGPPEPENITAALDGTSRDVLVAMRKALAKKLDGNEIAGNSVAAAYRELREVDRLIRVADAEAAAEEAKRNASNSGGRRSFDPQAI